MDTFLIHSCFQVRLYDPKRQRRPTISFEWEDSPLTRISAVPSSNGWGRHLNQCILITDWLSLCRKNGNILFLQYHRLQVFFYHSLAKFYWCNRVALSFDRYLICRIKIGKGNWPLLFCLSLKNSKSVWRATWKSKMAAIFEDSRQNYLPKSCFSIGMYVVDEFEWFWCLVICFSGCQIYFYYFQKSWNTVNGMNWAN